LEAAVDLARRHNAKLVGLFVEDFNLIRLAQLPFAYEVVRQTAKVRQLGLADMERQLRMQARRARRTLMRQARRYGLDWDFHVARGEVPLEVMAKADESDWIILGKTGWSQGDRAGSTTRAVLNQAERVILVLDRGLNLKRPVVSLYDGSEVARRSLATAAMLAKGQGVGISIFLVGGSKEDMGQLKAEASALLQEHEARATYRWHQANGSHSLVRAVKQIGCLLVLPAGVAGLAGDSLVELIDQLSCPVLVVR
jgi:nucleotide-binding universal stress UspA family protein